MRNRYKRPDMRQTCEQCHGTGQRCYFKGESRFLLSQDECPVCCGLGFVETDEAETHTTRESLPPDATSPPDARG